MKKILPSSLFTTLFILFTFIAAARVYNDNGTATFYDLKNGDTLKINAGNYIGRIQNYEAGWVIIVSSNGAFIPSQLDFPKGTIYNYGRVLLNFTLNSDGNFRLENYGTFGVIGAVNMNGNTQYWNNYSSGVMGIGGNVSMNANATLNNLGQLLINGALTVNSNATVINKGLLDVINTMTVNGGRVTNNGRLNVKKRLTINGGSTFTNTMAIIAEDGFTNNGALITNNGLLWVNSTANNTNDFVNSGQIVNGPGSAIRSRHFTNWGTVTGTGNLYFTSTTLNTGTIGVAGNTTDTLKIYDTSRSNPPQIFDTQWGTVNANSIFKSFPQPDTAGYYNMFNSGFGVLPISWKHFSVTAANGASRLSWSADYESGMRFTVERSYDETNFTALTTVAAQTSAVYEYTDNSNSNHPVIYYRIKAVSQTGEIKFSTTKVVKGNIAKVSVSIHPNPTAGRSAVMYNATGNESISIQLRTINGTKMSSASFNATAGANRFDVQGLQNAAPGIYVVEIWSDNRLVSAQQIIKQ